MTTIKIFTKKEIEAMIKDRVKKETKEYYIQLNKLRNKIIDLEQLIKYFKRWNNKTYYLEQ